MRFLLAIGVLLLSATVAFAEMGFDEKYQRDYNIFNPINQFRADNPLNPINSVDPKNPFNPINSVDPGNPANPINQFNPNNPFNPINEFRGNNPLNPINQFNPKRRIGVRVLFPRKRPSCQLSFPRTPLPPPAPSALHH